MVIRHIIAAMAIASLVAGGASAEVNKARRHAYASLKTHRHHAYATLTTRRRLASRTYRPNYSYASPYRNGYAPPPGYGPPVGYGPPIAYSPAYYGPAFTGQAAYTAYSEVAPVYIRPRGYGRQAWTGETSPGADTSVMLRGYADPTTGVTAAPNPNNVSDQVPSRGPDIDGPPPERRTDFGA